MFLSLFLYVCGTLVMIAYVDAAPLYPTWHSKRWIHGVMVVAWPVVVVFGVVVVCSDWVRGMMKGDKP